MRELSSVEIEEVNGGLIPLAVVLGFVAYNAEKIEDFTQGFFDGLSGERTR